MRKRRGPPRSAMPRERRTVSERAQAPRGLCDSCRHQQLVPNSRGSVFSLCKRSRRDPSYPRYPRIPVIACSGHEPRGES